jgi:4-hydroxybenzoate polyprenyltransferase
MGFNRLVDAGYDAKNPRTAMREIPRGLITHRAAAAFVAGASLVFVAAAAAISPLCLALSPIALAIVFWYSLAKRYTTYTQAFLGLAMAVAPVGGWLAAGGCGGPAVAAGLPSGVGGRLRRAYACQDLSSIARRPALDSGALRRRPLTADPSHARRHDRGDGRARVVANLGQIYVGGVAAGAALPHEQSLVRVDDLSQVKRAFDLNGYVGILYLVTTTAAIYVR